MLLTLFLAAVMAGEDAPDFTRDVQPILTAHCSGCHNAEDAGSGFRTDSFAGVTAPVEDEFAHQNGPSLIAGDAASSRIVRLMTGVDEPRMPPVDDADAVPDDQVAIIRRWIDAGAKGPSGEAAAVARLVVPSLPPAGGDGPVTSIVASGETVYRGAYGRLAAVRGETPLWSFTELPGKVNDLAMTSDGRMLLVASGVAGLRGEVVVVDAESGKEVRRIIGHSETLYAVATSGELIATAGYDRVINVWDLATGELLQPLTGHNGAVFDLAFSPDGSVLVSASADETVKVWDPRTGERLSTMSEPEGEVTSVAFSVDGRSVLAASADNRVRRWTLESSGRAANNPLELARFVHERAVTALAIDDARVVTASADGSVKVWDARDVSLLKTWPDQPDVVTALDIAADSLVVARMDGSVGHYELPSTKSRPPAASVAVTPLFPDDAGATEVAEAEPNDGPDTAASVDLPTHITGFLGQPGDADLFAFEAKAGEQWVLETTAARPGLGDNASKADTLVEVLDADGQPIERLRLQAVRDSYFTFRGKNSTQSDDFRVFNWQEIELGEYFYAAGEVTRFWTYPAGPDSGFQVFPGIGEGDRHTYFDTTPVTHALGEPGYVVRPIAAGGEAPPNGLPVFPVHFRNDDESTQRLGKDSHLTFTAPADGRYLARVADVRGEGSPQHTYTLDIRPRRPDVSGWLGGAVDKPFIAGAGREWQVSIHRLDGFAGPVEVRLENLPAGFSAPPSITIEAEQRSARFALQAAKGVAPPTPEEAADFGIRLVGTAEDGREVSHVITKRPKFEVSDAPLQAAIAIEAPLIDGKPTFEIRPGETRTLVLMADRRSFEGRIEFGKQDAGRNLPWGVFVDNIGLNGLMLTPDESRREFFVTAAPVAEPQDRWFHLRATNVHGGVTSRPIRIRVLPPNAGIASR